MFSSVLESDVLELMCCATIDHSPLTESFLLLKLLVMRARVKFTNFCVPFGGRARQSRYQLGRPGIPL